VGSRAVVATAGTASARVISEGRFGASVSSTAGGRRRAGLGFFGGISSREMGTKSGERGVMNVFKSKQSRKSRRFKSNERKSRRFKSNERKSGVLRKTDKRV
jgi:hypothetical protein